MKFKFRQFVRMQLVTLALLTAPITSADDWLYTVRPGDKLWNIARDYCGSGRIAQAIADHNGLANIAQLKAGQRIAIPTNWLAFSPSNANVLQTTGDVFLLRDNGNREPAQTGATVNMGDHVITEQGAALITFADGSQISIVPNSRVLFNKLTAFGPAGMVDTHLRFTYGQGEAKVKPQSRGGRFRIQTPEGIAAVRGTRFRVGRTSDGAQPLSTTETLEGLVAFTGQGKQEQLPAGFGVAAGPGRVVREALLPPPLLDTIPNNGLTRTTPLSWQPLSGASTYVIEWATLEQPEIIFLSKQIPDTRTLPPEVTGRYILTLRGVSKNMIQGNNAKQQIEVLDPAPTALRHSATQAGKVTLQWDHTVPVNSYSLIIEAEHWQSARTLQSSVATQTTPLEAGVYRWRVQPAGGVLSATDTFTLLPQTPDLLQLAQDNLSAELVFTPAPAGIRYVIEVTDASGNLIQSHYTQERLQLELPRYGPYQLRVASEQNSLQSEMLITPIEARQKPWWLILFFPLMFI